MDLRARTTNGVLDFTMYNITTGNWHDTANLAGMDGIYTGF
jgi:hypothetical protein